MREDRYPMIDVGQKTAAHNQISFAPEIVCLQCHSIAQIRLRIHLPSLAHDRT